nr:immunoglobulin light chain junction region [Macaca mulatta]
CLQALEFPPITF